LLICDSREHQPSYGLWIVPAKLFLLQAVGQPHVEEYEYKTNQDMLQSRKRDLCEKNSILIQIQIIISFLMMISLDNWQSLQEKDLVTVSLTENNTQTQHC